MLEIIQIEIGREVIPQPSHEGDQKGICQKDTGKFALSLGVENIVQKGLNERLHDL